MNEKETKINRTDSEVGVEKLVIPNSLYDERCPKCGYHLIKFSTLHIFECARCDWYSDNKKLLKALNSFNVFGKEALKMIENNFSA